MNNKERWRRGTRLFWAFFRIGAFTFGGGYAMLPLVEKEFVSNTGWMSQEEVMDNYALAQSIPGVIAVNTALLMGHRLAGVFGAFMAGLGVIIPSIVVIIGVSHFFARLIHSQGVAHVFQGVRACVVVLIVVATEKFARRSVKNRWFGLIALAAFLLSALTNMHVIVIMLMGGVAGLFIAARPIEANRSERGDEL